MALSPKNSVIFLTVFAKKCLYISEISHVFVSKDIILSVNVNHFVGLLELGSMSVDTIVPDLDISQPVASPGGKHEMKYNPPS
jgi:hypothetical protein